MKFLLGNVMSVPHFSRPFLRAVFSIFAPIQSLGRVCAGGILDQELLQIDLK
jgi:hypothetical protein